MADARRRAGLWTNIGLGLYACVCLIVFLWVRFPYDSLKFRIEDALTRGVRAPVSLGHIRPNLLWGFRVDGVEVKGARVAERLTISPRPWDLVRGRLGFGFHADMGSGKTDGRMRIPFKQSREPMELSMDMAQVDLAAFSPLLPEKTRPTGVVTGQLNLFSSREALDKTVGSLTLSWKKGSLPLNMDTLPFDALTFDNLDLDGRIEKGLLNLEKVEFTGEFSGTMMGSVRLSPEFKRSRLNITGEITLPEAMRKNLEFPVDPSGQPARFSLRGSVENPRFRMLSAAGIRPPRRQAAAQQALPGPAAMPAERAAPERTRQVAAPPEPEPADQSVREPLDDEEGQPRQNVEQEDE
ncbi:MAG TPA: type II secretion system protein GspN [Deltaproteobacteria bacterium]|nr:type II secretion system protein GspN [Deltaproteobacteria bacterium]